MSQALQGTRRHESKIPVWEQGVTQKPVRKRRWKSGEGVVSRFQDHGHPGQVHLFPSGAAWTPWSGQGCWGAWWRWSELWPPASGRPRGPSPCLLCWTCWDTAQLCSARPDPTTEGSQRINHKQGLGTKAERRGELADRQDGDLLPREYVHYHQLPGTTLQSSPS